MIILKGRGSTLATQDEGSDAQTKGECTQTDFNPLDGGEGKALRLNLCAAVDTL